MLARAVLAAASVYLAAADGQRTCVDETWHLASDRCFKGFMRVTTHGEAQRMCEGDVTGGRLASADTADVVAKLKTIMDSMSSKLAWTGGVCKHNGPYCADVSRWTWGEGGTAHGSFENGLWGNGFPRPNNGHCTYIDNNSGSPKFKNWYLCNDKLQYICEVASMEPAPPPNYNKDECAAVTLPSGKAGCEALGCIAKMNRHGYKACHPHKSKTRQKNRKKNKKVKCKRGSGSQQKCEGLGGGGKCRWNENARKSSKKCVGKK